MATSVLSNLVDEFGKLKAQISSLTKREKELKDMFIVSNLEEIDGKLFRVTVSSSDRETLDMDLVRKYLTHEQLQECTRVTPVTMVRCSSRKR